MNLDFALVKIAGNHINTAQLKLKYKIMGLIINVDKIEKIYTMKSKQAKHVRFYDAIPEKYTFFGLIKKQNAKPGFWCEGFWCEGYSWMRYETREDLVKSNPEKYYINHNTLSDYSIWEKANIHIEMSNNDDFTKYYDTIEELNASVNDIISTSRNNLVVIEK